eukprot:scaffold26118_cov171-Cylindrotheca_fusiformis.AAC.1
MSSTTTVRRKGGPSKSTEGFKLAVPLDAAPLKAEVRRQKCGTGPFDESWLNKDCCGLFCAFLTYCLHIYGVYAVCMILLPPWMSTLDEEGVRSMTLWGHLHRLLFTTTAVLAVYAHFKAMTTDPGAVPPDATPLSEDSNNVEAQPGGETDALNQPKRGKRLCRRCNSFKPKRAHHCSVCRRCIIKMDRAYFVLLCEVVFMDILAHCFVLADHCPWVNNCVGIGNHKYFLLFIFYTCLSCIYSFSLVVVRFYACMVRHGHGHTHHLTCLDRPTQLMSILGLVVEAILFGLFTSCMICDQAGVVTSNMTHIDRLKGDAAANAISGIIEVFGLSNKREASDGVSFRPDWLSPFAKVCFPGSLQEEIMGFCRPCANVRSRPSAETELIATSPMVRSVQEIV